jgi:alpha-glucosidase
VDVARGIRQAVKQTRPDAYLLGENFFDATDQLQGDQFDGVMNYGGFTKPLRHWLQGYRQGAWGMNDSISSPLPYPTEALAAGWQSRLAAIPWSIALQQFNLLASHDTQRIQTQVGGNEALHRLAAAVLLTFPGAPSIYYGDEIGLSDLPQLGSRGCMVWDERRWNRGLLDFYRTLISLRRRSPALQRGGFQVLAVEPETFAFQRATAAESVLVIAHRGQQPRPAGPLAVAHGGIPDGARFVEPWSGTEAAVTGGALELPEQPQGATVWMSSTK